MRPPGPRRCRCSSAASGDRPVTLAASTLPEPRAGRPLVMGVVNVTPDSFSDGGAWFTPEDAVAHGRDLVAQGADLLDIGGESTRPGAERPSLAEELRRVDPGHRGPARGGARVGGHDARRRRGRRPGCRCQHRQRRQRRAGRPRDGCVGGGAGGPVHRDALARAQHGDAVAGRVRRRRGRRLARADGAGRGAHRAPAWRPSASSSTPVSGSPRRPSTTGSSCAASTRSWRWAPGARRHLTQDLPRPRRTHTGCRPPASRARRRHRGHDRPRGRSRGLGGAGARRRRGDRHARRGGCAARPAHERPDRPAAECEVAGSTASSSTSGARGRSSSSTSS